MILSDKSIREKIKHGIIGITPAINDDQIQPASLDVKLGSEIYDIEADDRRVEKTHVLEPGRRYLGHTKEQVDLPNDIAAQLAGRSSIGRQGVIVHKTAGWIDPGFRGEITLELMNLGEEPVVFEEGKRVAQLVFFVLDQGSSGYDGGYQHQTGATEAYNE